MTPIPRIGGKWKNTSNEVFKITKIDDNTHYVCDTELIGYYGNEIRMKSEKTKHEYRVKKETFVKNFTPC